MGNLNDLGQAEISIQNEEALFTQYLKLYEKSNPKNNYGWLSAVTAVSIIGLMLVAAFRTGFSFFLSSFMSMNEFLGAYISPKGVFFASLLEAVFAILGVEGFIVTSGLKNGIARSEEKLANSRKFTSLLLLGVSCTASLYQSSFLIVGTESVSPIIEGALMLFTGIGVPVAILFAAPYLGMMLNYGKLEEDRWLKEARAAWKQSREYRTMLKGSSSPAPQPTVNHERNHQTPSASKIIKQYRDSNHLDDKAPISPKSVVQDYYDRIGIIPTELDAQRLNGAVRTAMSRGG